MTTAPISAETSLSGDLDGVCRWLIERQGVPVRLDVEDPPLAGARLRLARPLSAPRAILCALWLLEDSGAEDCLLAGQLRFVAHPTAPGIRLSFSGRITRAMRSAVLFAQPLHAARQLVRVIVESIESTSLARPSTEGAVRWGWPRVS